ncbi:lactosylceramide 4-alpha-galactosyltransferase [Ricinus communis]|uniref:Lactosylceramide 4-alpha-galactosyltransferase, putative n=1 Tax=Ricinus communis TaxID=3988 RepID=B9SZC5_RICCO|nr:lactosylceramide 4-alpha-galactosyltransferase [Ricinus communis]EEF31028.1 lactosylceramide 4-alpha-galactosyltransferase, putative [Ricinus communis]|eukprot:XP_002531344.1 lactosylceramide 4-alpha-galactosyltransferase [Ricinus communis]
MRRVSYRLLAYAKTVIFSIILAAAIIFIFSADCFIYKEEYKRIVGVSEIHTFETTIRSSFGGFGWHSTRENIDEVRIDELNSLVAPFNVTEEERIIWFKRKLPGLEIFKSNELTRQFHSRVLEFFDQKCDVQFFMTWISPVSSFGRREFLAMDSLFKVHPNGCLMILSGTMDSIQGYRILKPLVDVGFKVAAVTPDLQFLFKNTPAEIWLQEMMSGNKDPGEIPLSQNLSNLIRLAVIYKYGGIYIDTDFIFLKSFKGLRNSIGAQSIDAVSRNWTRLNNAVLVFDKNHPLMYKFIEEFAATFDGNKWGHNGPYLVSRVVARVAGRPEYNNFTVLPPKAFYPVDWNRIGGFFKKPEDQAASRWVKAKLLQLSGETYGLHLWNKQSCRIRIEEGSVMAGLISDHCVICEYDYSS